MSPDLDYRPDPNDLEDAEFEMALRALRRRRLITLSIFVASLVGLFTVPWKQSIDASGRVAPARWAKVRSEVSGVVREVKRKRGETVQEGDVIAVLDSEEQRDALEAARLALTRERQKLADIELRLQQNRIMREGSDVAVEDAQRRALAADNVEDSRIEDLEPAATAVIEGIRGFTIKARSQLAIDGRAATPFRAEPMLHAIDAAMESYVERVEAGAEHLTETAGDEAEHDLRARLDSVRFTFALAGSSMREFALKHDVMVRGLLAPVELRSIVDQLERESRDLAQSLGAVATVARSVTGSPAERREWVRGAEEKRQLLAKEAERVAAERETVASSIATAELLVRAAERSEGKTAIHAPISGTLSETQLAELDGIGPHATVGVIEDSDRLVLKVRVSEADWSLAAEGQAVEASVGGNALSGTVVWKAPRAGQEVRDQEWNLLVRVDSEAAGVEPGDQVEATVIVGRRSLVGRLFDRKQSRQYASVAGTRLALIDDPTEQRVAGVVGELAASDAVDAGAHAADLAEPAGNN